MQNPLIYAYTKTLRFYAAVKIQRESSNIVRIAVLHFDSCDKYQCGNKTELSYYNSRLSQYKKRIWHDIGKNGYFNKILKKEAPTAMKPS